MSWRPNLKLRPGRRRKYDATHDELYAHVEAERALARQYEDEINLVPESHFDGNQIRMFDAAEMTKQERRAARNQRIFQTGAPD